MDFPKYILIGLIVLAFLAVGHLIIDFKQEIKTKKDLLKRWVVICFWPISLIVYYIAVIGDSFISFVKKWNDLPDE